MNGDHERYVAWDAAYALGALSAAERAEYEDHLASCARCRDAVAELGPTVSLLSVLDAGEAEQLDEVEGSDDAGPIRVLAEARERRRRRRRVGAWAAGAAAAVIVATALSLATMLPRPAEALEMEPVGGAPVTATVAMTTVPWGTKLDVTCEYDGSRAYGAGGEYVLAVVADDGSSTTLSTWAVDPGATAHLSAGTALPASGIRAIEIRDAAGTVVVRRELD